MYFSRISNRGHVVAHFVRGTAVVACVLAAAGASAEVVQTLERVDVYNSKNVLEMQFGNAARVFDFEVLSVKPGSSFKACQVSATQGLYCLDSKDVRFWSRAQQTSGTPNTGTRLFSCTNATLGFDTASADVCTGMTVDQTGAIWITGKRAGNADYALVRVTRRTAATCPSGTTQLVSAAYCAKQFATTSYLLTDLSSIDGDVGADFVGPNVSGPGILAIGAAPAQTLPGAPPGAKVRKTTLYFPSTTPAEPAVLATGNAQWKLSGTEQLQSTTMLQTGAGDELQSFVLATTTTGRIMAVEATGSAEAFQVFNIVGERVGTSCGATLAPIYGLRSGGRGPHLYLTDRSYCQALSLDWEPTVGQPFRLVNTQEDGQDLTFSTTAAYPPLSPTLAPGQYVNFAACATAEPCIIVRAPDGSRAASLSDVRLIGPGTGMNLFQIEGIPDCRWAPGLCKDEVDPAQQGQLVVDAAGAFVSLDDSRLGTAAANQFFLNVTPMLPVQITGMFDGSGAAPRGLPRMLISPQYRAQQQHDFRFGALFGITDPGVTFADTFNFEFDVLKLAGEHLGCGTDTSIQPNLDWDVVTTVSEKFVTAGGPGLVVDTANPNRYVDTILNTGCYNPTQGSGTRWSMYSYNLEIAPAGPDVLGALVAKLYDDLDETRSQLACKVLDGQVAGSGPPMKLTDCQALASLWTTGKTHLDQCLADAVAPRSSDLEADCATFAADLQAYYDYADGVVPAASDPANRIGELMTRSKVLKYLLNTRFLPSVPAGGFPAP